MFAHIIDDELQLVLLEPHHAEEFFAVVDANREHLRPWMMWLDDTQSQEDCLASIRNNFTEMAAATNMALVLRYRGKFVGRIGAHNQQHDTKICEIGYWLAKDVQGHGVMTRAVKGFVHMLFHDYGFQRLTIRCAPENQRSRAIAERLGFTQEGIWRRAALQPGNTPDDPPKLTDLVIYSLLDNEYYHLPWAQTLTSNS